MRIAIIGAGNVGRGLAAAAAAAGHDVVVSATTPASAEEAAGQTPALAVAEAHQEHRTVGALDHADGAHGVRRRDRAHHASPGSHR